MTTGGGNMNAYNLTINTSGTSSAAIRTDRGGGNCYSRRWYPYYIFIYNIVLILKKYGTIFCRMEWLVIFNL